jgi:hypothetical protein
MEDEFPFLGKDRRSVIPCFVQTEHVAVEVEKSGRLVLFVLMQLARIGRSANLVLVV